MEQKYFEKVILDSSALSEGIVSKLLMENKICFEELIIPEALVSEVEYQIQQNRAFGFLGIEEIQKLKELSSNKFRIKFSGKKLSHFELERMNLLELDSMIRDLAYEEGACLITTNKFQEKISTAKGIDVLFIEPEEKTQELEISKFFDEQTMSVHLRENNPAFAKKGFPGNWNFVKLGENKLTREDISRFSRNIIEVASSEKNAFIEIERKGSTIVQIGNFRIVITKPPLSDGWEITAVRPVKKMSLQDYNLSEKLIKRISEQAEGILIAGAPGHGKSTFAQALAEFYASKQKIVKTIEAPRDLVLPDSITQYAISYGSPQEIHDILLLSRPDYTIFDEMRNTEDFQLFADLRLAGIGLAGVVHATNPIDAIQRFVGRIELGVIPQVIDTVIFIKNGVVYKVLSLQMVVKVPSGMTEADLARPVVVVTDFETSKLEYELYSYGEETVVVPVKTERSPLRELASKSVEDYFRAYSDEVEIDFVSDSKCIVRVPANKIAAIIGKQGKNIDYIEKKLGISIDVQELEKKQEEKESLRFDFEITKKAIILKFKQKYAGRNIDLFVDDEFLMNVNIGANGIVKITKNNKIGKIIEDALNSGKLDVVLRK
ncbi:MAG: PINc/VapC family ATPase [Candidatus Woesearchaeota archaeon]